MKAELRCAWCNELMGHTDTPDGSTSHGICLTCLWKHFPDAAVKIIAHHQAETAGGIPASHSEVSHAA